MRISSLKSLPEPEMKGWLPVSPDALETDDQLLDMLRLGVSFVETLAKK